MSGENSEIQPIWCLAANLNDERLHGEGGAEVRHGTKHFAPGAKVYFYPPLWGDGYSKMQMIGRHRVTHRFVIMVIESRWLIRWRAERVYSPRIIREMESFWDEKEESKKWAEEWTEFCNARSSDHR